MKGCVQWSFDYGSPEAEIELGPLDHRPAQTH